MIYGKVIVCSILGCSISSSNAFAPLFHQHTQARREQPLSDEKTSDLRSRRCLALDSSSSSLSSEIFLLSFDGTVARTTEWRISQGIELALLTWPQLEVSRADIADDRNDRWLQNKMSAVASVLACRRGCSLSVDYALLARLLIEEQKLDRGRSNGSGGKYGSKYHPQSSSSSSSRSTAGRSTRPLTVGEIAENWNKGGCLVEAVLSKYHVNYKNPLPILQQKINEFNQQEQVGVLEINEGVKEMLKEANGKTIITVGHESELEVARNSLEAAGISTAVLPNDVTKLSDFLNNGNGTEDHTKILAISTTHGDVYNSFLKASPAGSILYIFESSWDALEQGVRLFGDNIPRGGSGMAETIEGRQIKMSLNFPKWSASPSALPGSSKYGSGNNKNLSDLALQNEAIMNPWTNLVGESDFAELLSARIV